MWGGALVNAQLHGIVAVVVHHDLRLDADLAVPALHRLAAVHERAPRADPPVHAKAQRVGAPPRDGRDIGTPDELVVKVNIDLPA